MNEEVTQCNVLQTESPPSPFEFCCCNASPPKFTRLEPFTTVREGKKGHEGGNIKKRGQQGEKKTERKEQVLVIKRAAMRSSSRVRTDWVVLSPSLCRNPHVLCIRDNVGLSIKWYLHVTDRRCRNPSRVIQMQGPQLLFWSWPMLKLLSKSSKFIVHVQVSWIFFSHSTFSILLPHCIVNIRRLCRLQKKIKFIRNIFVSKIKMNKKKHKEDF